MHRFALFAAVLAVLWLPSLAQAANCRAPGDVAAAAEAVLQGANAARARAGLAPLALSPTLIKAAQGHACDMARSGKMSHVGSNGSSHAYRAKAAGCRWKGALAENVGHNYSGPAQAMGSWMGSPHHRDNILNRKVKVAGAAYATGPNGPYWVLMLAGAC